MVTNRTKTDVTFVNVIQSVSLLLIDDNWNTTNKTLKKHRHQNIYVQLPKCMCIFTRRAQMPKGRCAFTGIVQMPKCICTFTGRAHIPKCICTFTGRAQIPKCICIFTGRTHIPKCICVFTVIVQKCMHSA